MCFSIHDCIDYMSIDYIDIDSAMFSPEIKNTYGLNILSTLISRTRNACESFYSKFSGKLYYSYSNYTPNAIQALNEVYINSSIKINHTDVRNLR